MQNLQPSFSSNPDQDPHKYFKYLLIDFKKEVKNQVDIEDLEEKMQAIINASKQMHYTDPHKKGVFHKPETEKALNKIFNEFDRYIKTLQENPSEANAQDLLDSISLVQELLKENEIY